MYTSKNGQNVIASFPFSVVIKVLVPRNSEISGIVNVLQNAENKSGKKEKVYAEKRNVLEKLVRNTFPRLFLTTYSLPFSYVVACSSTANWLNRRNFSAWEIWESQDSSLRRSGFGGNFSWTVPSSARLKFHLINLTSAPYSPPYPHPSSS